MKTPRQKGLILMVSEEFLAELDAIWPKLGYDSRASFVRDAVVNELDRKKNPVADKYRACPGSGVPRGRPKKYSSEEPCDLKAADDPAAYNSQPEKAE